MDKVKFTQIEMLKKRAADELNKMWDAATKGDEDLERYYWDCFVKTMNGARQLRKSEVQRWKR